MPKMGIDIIPYRYADRFYMDRANKDTYLERDAAGDVGFSGNLVLPALKTVDGMDPSVHAADLDAHTRDYFEILRTGLYHITGGGYAGNPMAFLANKLYAVPYLATRKITVDSIGNLIHTVGAGGKVARLGIYGVGTNLYPGSLIVDAGEVAIDAVDVVTAVINEQLTKGLYFLAIIGNDNFSLWSVSNPCTPLGLGATLRHSNTYWSVAQAYGALPDPYTAGGVLGVTTFPIVAVEVASND